MITNTNKQITTYRILDATINSDDIASDAVVGSKLPDDAVGYFDTATEVEVDHADASPVDLLAADSNNDRLVMIQAIASEDAAGGPEFDVGSETTDPDAAFDDIAAGAWVTDERFVGFCLLPAGEKLQCTINAAGTAGKIKFRSVVLVPKVQTAQIADKAVTTAKINDKAVEQGQIGDKAVDTGQIQDLAVETAKLGAKAVTTDKIDDKAVDTGQLADGAVEALQINADAVETDKIKDDAVTEGKLQDVNSDGLHAHRVARATYDFAEHGGAQGTIGLGVTLPDNAIVVRAWYEVLTTLTSATDAATVSLDIPTDDPAGLLAAIAINDGTDPWDAGHHECIQDGTAANFSEKCTAARELSMTVATEDLTNGKFILWVEYIVSD